MGLPLLLASGYLVFPLMCIVYNVIKTWIKKKKKRKKKLLTDVLQPIPGLISCVEAMCKGGQACIISLTLSMDKTMQPPDFLSYTRYQSPSPGQLTRPGIVRKAFHSVSDSVSQLVLPLTWPIDCSCTQCMLPWRCVFCSAAANSLQTRRVRVPSAQTSKE